MAPIAGDWQEALKGEFHQPYYAKLYKTVMTEYRTRKIFPPPEDLFNAFHFTPLHQVKVVILGRTGPRALFFRKKRCGNTAIPGEYL